MIPEALGKVIALKSIMAIIELENHGVESKQKGANRSRLEELERKVLESRCRWGNV